MQSGPSAEYDARLLGVLQAKDWRALREFTCEQNQIPDDVYEKDEHFWEVLMHKLICNRIDTLALHAESSKWLAERGYTSDLGGY